MVTEKEVRDEAIEHLRNAVLEPRGEKRINNWRFVKHLHRMDSDEFEAFWAALKRRCGFAAYKTRDSHERGIDTVAVKRLDSGAPWITLGQTKLYRSHTRLGPKELDGYVKLLEYGHEVEIVVAHTVSDRTRELARERGLTLYEPDDIYELVRDANAWDLLGRYGRHPKLFSLGSIDVAVGILIGGLRLTRTDNEGVRSLDPNLTPRDVFIEAARLLRRYNLIHGDFDIDDINGSPFIDNDYDDTDDLPDGAIEVVEGIYIDGDEWWGPESEWPPEVALVKLLRALLELVANQHDLAWDDPHPLL